MSTPVTVMYLFSRACPSHEEGLALLHRAADRADVSLALDVREVLTDEEARRVRFPGSPTYLVEGRDVADPPSGVPYVADGCRAYVRPDGRIGPLPHIDTLAAALRAAGDPPSPEAS